MTYKILNLTTGSYLKGLDIQWQYTDRSFVSVEQARAAVDFMCEESRIQLYDQARPKLLPCYFEIIKV